MTGSQRRYTAHEIDVHDADEDPNFDQEESCEEESDLTAAFESEMDELASVVEELEDTLDCTGRGRSARTFRVHAKLREKTRKRGHQPSSSASCHSAFGSRQSSVSGSGRGKKGNET